MNKQRRKQLGDLQDRLLELEKSLDALHTERDAIAEALESLRDEEQEAFDNMPESLQQSEQGQDIENAVDRLTEALDNLQGFDLDHDVAGVVSDIDDARGQA
jgi:septation ring formation regulator EzrA